MVLVKQDPDSDVKFTLADQQGSLDVLLDDKSVVLDLVGCCVLL